MAIYTDWQFKDKEDKRPTNTPKGARLWGHTNTDIDNKSILTSYQSAHMPCDLGENTNCHAFQSGKEIATSISKDKCWETFTFKTHVKCW
jgi:hypothetical protein